MLANGVGGFDWAGLPLAAAYTGADADPAGLIHRLQVIKGHKPLHED